jgi:hypothetical protein
VLAGFRELLKTGLGLAGFSGLMKKRVEMAGFSIIAKTRELSSSQKYLKYPAGTPKTQT